MSDGLNKVLLFGNLGADPELRVVSGGQSILTIRLATTEVWFDKEGTKKENTQWHRVKVFGKRADALSKLLSKGDRVLVEGRLSTSSWEKEGTKRYGTDVVAVDIWLAGAARGAETNGGFTRAFSPPPVADEVPF